MGDAGNVVETITFDGGSYHGYDLYLADDEGDEVFRGTYALSTGTGTALTAEAGVNTVLVDTSGNAATKLTGDSGADQLFGNGGADILDGGVVPLGRAADAVSALDADRLGYDEGRHFLPPVGG